MLATKAVKISDYTLPIAVMNHPVQKIRIHEVSMDLCDYSSVDDYYLNYGIELPEHAGNISIQRKTEYFIGRLAAQKALFNLTQTQFSVSRGAHSEPVWPTGVVGSISHAMFDKTRGYAISSVLKNSDVLGMGIDVELISSQVFFDSIRNMALSGYETRYITSRFDDYQLMGLAIFSAKESIYKAIPCKYQQGIHFKMLNCLSINREQQIMEFHIPRLKELNFVESLYVGFHIHTEKIITGCLMFNHKHAATMDNPVCC
ncbi:4'-phosphopantetheinyl transferase superfamily protein [Acinetobacter qingfengensis]|uniref:Enterobactin synthase component D n=1 Tax=Acinetobacter qingfengensis TaxID=1262585 RepID=A0A1E7R877_9GAMM|nr:4'-phosphopantetheinyl transferase superfamily protein [Acinetobacter qingfengensis]KAA8734717.1 4'-phosphopantetheinyl transferase superfamily protein [Acinetobacter qingfengensis]OEY95538.1 hypothetical protein BJI46_12750 [Acinetobacter qingfengensis]